MSKGRVGALSGGDELFFQDLHSAWAPEGAQQILLALLNERGMPAVRVMGRPQSG